MFLFVEGHSQKRTKSDRSHAARVGRQKRSKALQPITPPLSRHSSVTNDSTLDSEKHLDVIAVSPRTPDEIDAKPIGFIVEDDDEGSESASTPRSDDSELQLRTDHDDLPPPLQHTISPIFGTVSGTWKHKESGLAADSAHYWLNIVMGSFLQPLDKPMWFNEFCSHPLVYHVGSYVVGVYQEASLKIPARQQTLRHQIKMIQMVNNMLRDLQEQDIEAILLAICALWKVHSPSITANTRRLLFKPHMPDSWLIYATSSTKGDDLHSRALFRLVDKIGGLKNLKKLPRFAFSLAYADILSASAQLTRPVFPSIWEDYGYLESVRPIFDAKREKGGAGFGGRRLPGGLPNGFQETLDWMQDLDRFLEKNKKSPSDSVFLVETRNAVQHRLLNSPNWNELGENEREGSYCAVYEICRLTALIYVNAVLFPIGTASGWVTKLIDELVLVIETSNLAVWKDEQARRLLLWSVFVATMASYWTPLWENCVRLLRKTLLHTQLEALSLDESCCILRNFLWTESACGDATAVAWEAAMGECKASSPRRHDGAEIMETSSPRYHYAPGE